jgi:hypothetical protein
LFDWQPAVTKEAEKQPLPELDLGVGLGTPSCCL